MTLSNLDIVEIYINLIKNLKRLPTYTDMHIYGVSRDSIRKHFGNLSHLHSHVLENNSDQISDHILHENYILKCSQQALDGKNKFVITTVVNEKPIHKEFYLAIKKYCELNDAILICLPSIDVWNVRTRNTWTFDSLLFKELFAFDELKINDNLFINNVTQNSKNVNPTTGFSRLVQKKGSLIFASPKQNLEFVIHSPNNQIPRAMMTTGALTTSYYEGNSAKQNYMAENDHVLGAIIVEKESDEVFHFRQIQSNDLGEFIDLGFNYSTKGRKREKNITAVLGDWHSGQTNSVVVDSTKDIIKELKIKNIVLHDLFDGRSVSPHDMSSTAKMAKRSWDELSLEHEFEKGARDLEMLLSNIDGKLYITKGNHDEFLERYVINGSFMNDRINYYIGLDLSMKYQEGENILKYGYEKYGNLRKTDRIVWLERDESFEIGGVQCGQHGDKGLNGSKGTLPGIEKAYGSAIVGHAHSPAILRGVYRVGTSTDLKLDYNKGPSSWSNCHCLIYENGMRQLIQIIRGSWRI